MRIALFEPDIAQNAGAVLRLAACMGVGVDIVGQAGFPWSSARFRRAGMDYLDHVEIVRHDDFESFDAARRAAGSRLIAMTTHADTPYTGFAFTPADVLLAGRESAGLPEDVRRAADARIVIPMRPGMRSLNVAIATAMILGEALRQTAAA